MAKVDLGSKDSCSNEAIMQLVLGHGVPVEVIAKALAVSRQTIYRRMQRARLSRRRAARAARELAEPESCDAAPTGRSTKEANQ